MPAEQVTIQTRDGECPALVMTPAGQGRWPATIFYMDGGGIRPAVLEMAQRLANGGYVVLLPDLFYRYGPYETLVPKEVFKGDVRAILGPLMATTDNNKAAEDTKAFRSPPGHCRPQVRRCGFLHGRRHGNRRRGHLSRSFRGGRELPRRQSRHRRADQSPPAPARAQAKSG